MSADFLKAEALANETRLKILEWLSNNVPTTGAYSSMIAEGIGVRPAMASFHLNVLARAGILDSFAAGRHVMYKLSREGLYEHVQYLIGLMGGDT